MGLRSDDSHRTASDLPLWRGSIVDRELPEDRVAPEHRGVETLLDCLLAGIDVLQFLFDGLANPDVVAEAQAPAVRGGLGVE